MAFPHLWAYCVSVINTNGTLRRYYDSPFLLHYSKPALHTIGSGRIVVTFNQPVIIDVIRFYLWDKGNRKYSYYVEVSKNLTEWVEVADCRKVKRSGQQEILIGRDHVLISIRIIGTKIYPKKQMKRNEKSEFCIVQCDFPDYEVCP